MPPCEVPGDARAPDQAAEIDVTWGISIHLWDGVHLNATLYQSHDQTGPLPVIFTLTPYIADTWHDRVTYFAGQGYVFASVAMWGGSYAGFDQWATLKEAPAHLATIAPVASVGTGVDYPAPGSCGSR